MRKSGGSVLPWYFRLAVQMGPSMQLASKLPKVGTTIFTVMSQLAQHIRR